MNPSEAGWKTWYSETYLQSEAWKARRDAVLRRAQFVCEGCGERPATQVHHRPEAYRQLRQSGRELLCDLVALCEDCHGLVAHADKPKEPMPKVLRDDLHSRILDANLRMDSLRKEAREATGERLEDLRDQHANLCELVLRLEEAWRSSPEARGAA
jgi:hypothetical protein